MRFAWLGVALALTRAEAARIVRLTRSGATIVEHEGVRYRIEKGGTKSHPFCTSREGEMRHADPDSVTQGAGGPIVEEGENRILVTAEGVMVLHAPSSEVAAFEAKAKQLPSERFVHTLGRSDKLPLAGDWNAFIAIVLERLIGQHGLRILELDAEEQERFYEAMDIREPFQA